MGGWVLEERLVGKGGNTLMAEFNFYSSVQIRPKIVYRPLLYNCFSVKKKNQ